MFFKEKKTKNLIQNTKCLRLNKDLMKIYLKSKPLKDFCCDVYNFYLIQKTLIEKFFLLNPFFFYGMIFLISIFYFFTLKIYLLLFLLIFSFFNTKKLICTFLIFSFGFFFTYYRYPDINKIASEVYGSGIFKIENSKSTVNFGKKMYIYSGQLKEFYYLDKKVKNLPISIYAQRKLSSKSTYKVEGKLIPISTTRYILKIKKEFLKKAHTKKISFLDVRNEMKTGFSKYLKKNIFDKNSYFFIKALILGDIENKFLSFAFSKVGLSHILAISGFHFGILVLFIFMILKNFPSKNLNNWILLILVNLYFLFVGPSPSVQRAYIMIMLAIVAKIISRQYLPINGLGFALFLSLFYDPKNIFHIGFQLSYLSCFAIFLFFPLLSKINVSLIEKIFKNPFKSKIGSKIFNFLTSSILLSIAINFTILPALLYHFNKFSYLSFIYNLFVPLVVTFIMILTLITLMISIISPYISKLLFTANTFIIKTLLIVIFHPPAKLLYFLRVSTISEEFVAFYLLTIFFAFIILNNIYKEKKENIYLEFI
ncbi:MAG: ComEC/Rec2 family competence protein [Parachlamydiales bacterium]|nr:ComEC/Rec2 family competence protein [Parachlamydiales bacterium]